MKNAYDTLSEAINDLKNSGYNEDLNLKNNCVECKALNYEIVVEDFIVDRAYRFEGDTNPDDASILFAISAPKYNLKGLLVDAYGAYASPLTSEMIQKLRYRPS